MTCCSTVDTPEPKPEIIVNPYSVFHESISGNVEAVDVVDYNILVYASINDSWYSVLSGQNQVISLNEDASWNCQMGNYASESLDRIYIYLIPNGYQPPVLSGENLIPVKLNLIAAARKSIIP